MFFLQLFPTFSLVLKNLVGRRFLMLVSALGMAVAQVHLPIAFLSLNFTMSIYIAFQWVFNCQSQCSLGFYFQALDSKQRAQPSLCSDDNLMGSSSQNLNNSTEVNVFLSAQLIQARPFIIVRILKFLHIIIIMVMVLVQARSILIPVVIFLKLLHIILIITVTILA